MPQFAFLKNVYFGNSVAAYLLAGATFLAVLWGFLLARRIFINRLQALAKLTETHLDDLVVQMLQKVRAPECYVVAFYMALRPPSEGAQPVPCGTVLLVYLPGRDGTVVVGLAVDLELRAGTMRCGGLLAEAADLALEVADHRQAEARGPDVDVPDREGVAGEHGGQRGSSMWRTWARVISVETRLAEPRSRG